MRRRRRWRLGRRLGRRSGTTAFVALLVAAILALSREARRPGDPAAPGELPRGGAAAGSRFSASVRWAADGDTLTLADGREVRLLGIDSPEAGEPWADEARWENTRLAVGREVELWLAGEASADRYGRLLALVYREGVEPAAEKPCVNFELIRRGLAWVYVVGTDSVPDTVLGKLLDAQGAAIDARRGVWRRRLDPPAAEAKTLVATRWRIHRSSCREARSPSARPVISLEGEFRKGKSPCRECKPMAR